LELFENVIHFGDERSGLQTNCVQGLYCLEIGERYSFKLRDHGLGGFCSNNELFA
jgi:hypothetical protein